MKSAKRFTESPAAVAVAVAQPATPKTTYHMHCAHCFTWTPHRRQIASPLEVFVCEKCSQTQSYRLGPAPDTD